MEVTGYYCEDLAVQQVPAPDTETQDFGLESPFLQENTGLRNGHYLEPSYRKAMDHLQNLKGSAADYGMSPYLDPSYWSPCEIGDSVSYIHTNSLVPNGDGFGQSYETLLPVPAQELDVQSSSTQHTPQTDVHQGHNSMQEEALLGDQSFSWASVDWSGWNEAPWEGLYSQGCISDCGYYQSYNAPEANPLKHHPTASTRNQAQPGAARVLHNGSGPIQLWQFLLELLQDRSCQTFISWTGNGWEFKLSDPTEVARRWGKRKNKPRMTYEKLSRGLRYYYHKDIIHKTGGQRYVYRFVCDVQNLLGKTSHEMLQEMEIPALDSHSMKSEHTVRKHKMQCHNLESL